MNVDFYYNDVPQFTKDQVVIKLIDNYDWFKRFSGQETIVNPLYGEVLAGKNFYDVLYFYSDPGNIAISLKFKEVLLTNNISGWRDYTLKIKDCDKIYSGISIIGRCGELIRPLNKGWIDGFNFDLNTWDGSDLFCPEGTGYLFYSQKVKDLIKKYGIKRFNLKPITTIRWYSAGGVYKKNM